jgi:hypothetical protein
MLISKMQQAYSSMEYWKRLSPWMVCMSFVQDAYKDIDSRVPTVGALGDVGAITELRL